MLNNSLTSSSIYFNNGNPVKAKKNQVFVEKPEILDSLIDDISIDTDRNTTRTGQRGYNSTFTSNTTKSSMTKSRKLNSSTVVHDEATMKKKIQDHIEAKKAKAEEKILKLLDNVDKSSTMLREVGKTLSAHDYMEQYKYKKQYDDWNTGVHGSIQKKITQRVAAMDPKVLHKQKYDDYNKFIEITNRKANIYRDIIIESEYDPLEPNRRAIKVQLDKSTRDPTHFDALKREEERSMLIPGYKKPKEVLGKMTLPVEMWAADKIASTSFGFSSSSSSGISSSKQVDKEPTQRSSQTFQSRVIFDHYTFPRSNQAAEQEMPRGKRMIPKATTICLG